MDAWYRWADHFVEGQREARAYEYGALRGGMTTYDSMNGNTDYGRGEVKYQPYAADVPGVGKFTTRIIPDHHGLPIGPELFSENLPPGSTSVRWDKVKDANPWYFSALQDAAAVMPERRAKYSGEDPFDNFERVARITGTTVAKAFEFDIALKLARAQVGAGDFEDESFNDCLRDLANYALLWLGYRLKHLAT